MLVGNYSPSLDTIKSNVLNLADNQKNNFDKAQSFEDILKQGLTDLNNKQIAGYDAMQNIATGEAENLPEAISTISKAELSLKFALEVQSKALKAYQEIMRTQV